MHKTPPTKRPDKTPPRKSDKTPPRIPGQTKPGKSDKTPPRKPDKTPPRKPEQTKPGKSDKTPPKKPEQTPPRKSDKTPPRKPKQTSTKKSDKEPPKQSDRTPTIKRDETPQRKQDKMPPKKHKKHGLLVDLDTRDSDEHTRLIKKDGLSRKSKRGNTRMAGGLKAASKKRKLTIAEIEEISQEKKISKEVQQKLEELEKRDEHVVQTDGQTNPNIKEHKDEHTEEYMKDVLFRVMPRLEMARHARLRVADWNQKKKNFDNRVEGIAFQSFFSVVFLTPIIIPCVFLPDWNPTRHLNESGVLVVEEVGPWSTCSCPEEKWLDLKIIRYCHRSILMRACVSTVYSAIVTESPRYLSGTSVGCLVLAWVIATFLVCRGKCRRKPVLIISEVQFVIYILAVLGAVLTAAITVFYWCLEDYVIGLREAYCGFSPIIFSAGILFIGYRAIRLCHYGFRMSLWDLADHNHGMSYNRKRRGQDSKVEKNLLELLLRKGI